MVSGSRPDRIVLHVLFFFLLVFFVAAPSSVAYSQIAAAVVLLLWVLRAAARGESPLPRTIPRGALLLRPILVWIVVSIIVVLFARDRAGSATELLKLIPLGFLLLFPAILTTSARIRHVVGALIVGGVITSAYGIYYFHFISSATRLGGFVGFYMTTAGLLLQIIVVVFALLFTRGVGGTLRWIALGALPILLYALLLTDTRGAWLGLLAGLFVLVLALRPRAALVPLVLAALVLLIPGKPRETALSAFDPDHPRNRERLFMWKAGVEIFRDYPITGVGLAGMDRIYLEYQDPRSEEDPPHLHSVPIHMLASMGILGFGAWVYLYGSLLVWLVGAIRAGPGPPAGRALIAAAIATAAGFAVNGLVEWNLGDIEVVTLFWAVQGIAVAAAVRGLLPERV